MRLGGARESSNVEDRRGMGIGGGKMAVGGGCGTLLVIILALIFGVDPSQLLSGGGGPIEAPAPTQQRPGPPRSDEQSQFIRRVLGPAEARLMAMAGGFLLGLSLIAVKWPRGITYPLAFIGTWVAIALFIRAYKLRKGLSVRHEQERGEPPPPPAPEPAREGR